MLQDSPSCPPWLPRGELAHCTVGAGVLVVTGEPGSGWRPRAKLCTHDVTWAICPPIWAQVAHVLKKWGADWIISKNYILLGPTLSHDIRISREGPTDLHL